MYKLSRSRYVCSATSSFLLRFADKNAFTGSIIFAILLLAHVFNSRSNFSSRRTRVSRSMMYVTLKCLTLVHGGGLKNARSNRQWPSYMRDRYVVLTSYIHRFHPDSARRIDEHSCTRLGKRMIAKSGITISKESTIRVYTPRLIPHVYVYGRYRRVMFVQDSRKGKNGLKIHY